MISFNNNEICFPELPFWQGVQQSPGIKQQYPIRLGWDKRGFIKQTTSKQVREEVIDGYNDPKYNFITKPPGFSKWANRLGDNKINFVKKYFKDLQGKKILEVGAGSLYVAEHLANTFDIKDYLVMDPAVNGKSSNVKVRVINDYFHKEKCKGDVFDLIICFSVLEHVPDAYIFLLDLRHILSKSGGKAILVFPNIENSFKSGDWNVILHEHISYLSKNTAIKLFENCGLNVLTCEDQFDCFSFIVETGNAPLNKKTLTPDNLLSDVAEQLLNNLDQIKRSLTTSINNGETIAFHGACNGLNHILHLSGLTNNENILIFDGDESKTGHYLPGCTTPIMHSTDSKYKKIDKVFIAANSFYSEIKAMISNTHGINNNQILPLFRRILA